MLALGVLVWPRGVDAQRTGEMYRRLHVLGYTVGKNLHVESRWAEGRLDRLPALAAELVGLKPDVIIAAGNPAVNAARRATSEISIVMLSADPVAAGFVPSLSRPGGNLTGLSVDAGLGIWGKRLELLTEAAPTIRRVAVLSRTGGRQGAWVGQLDGAARRLGVTLLHAGVGRVQAFPDAFSAVLAERPDAVLASDTPLNLQHRRLIIDFAARHRLPDVHGYPEAAQDGGLMAYGVDMGEVYRRAAFYVDRLLQGASAGDLPIEQPAKFSLVINLKRARALGLAVPPALLLRADRVIQ